MSRPKKEVRRSEVIRFKMTEKEKQRLLEEAKKRELTVSDFIRIAVANEIDMCDLDYQGGYQYD